MKAGLTESQIERIIDEVAKGNIKPGEMKDDLVDHFCCVVEDEMSKGVAFDTALEQAVKRICPEGLDEIGKETLYLLPQKIRKRLEKLVYSSGFILLTGILITVVMKLLQVPGSGIILFAITLVLVMFFLPTLFVFVSKNVPRKKLTWYLAGCIGAESLVLFILFKTLHWPGAVIFLTIAVFGIYLALFPFFFFKIYKKDSRFSIKQ